MVLNNVKIRTFRIKKGSNNNNYLKVDLTNGATTFGAKGDSTLFLLEDFVSDNLFKIKTHSTNPKYLKWDTNTNTDIILSLEV